MNLQEIRRASLARLIPQYPSQAALARAAGITPQLLSALLVGATRSFGEKSARNIEAGLGLAPGWLDQDASGEAPQLTAGLDDGVIQLAQRIHSLSPRDRQTIETLVDQLAA